MQWFSMPYKEILHASTGRIEKAIRFSSLSITHILTTGKVAEAIFAGASLSGGGILLGCLAVSITFIFISTLYTRMEILFST